MTACLTVQPSPVNDTPPSGAGALPQPPLLPKLKLPTEAPVQATLTPIPTDTPTPTQPPTATPTPTAIPTSTPAPTPTPLPTATPMPTPTPAPTPTPTPEPTPTQTHTPRPQNNGSDSNSDSAPQSTPTPTPLPFSPGSTPHIFVGTATINGLAAPPGTMVSAWIDGTLSGIAEVDDNGEYGALVVGQIIGEPPYGGKTITFTIGSLTAGQTAIWQSGAADVLDLTATQ
jgi:hypothetical protein